MNDAHMLITDRFDGWPPHPGLFQLWVDDVTATLDDAVAAGAKVVTPATPFFAQTTLGRMVDSWGNLWWLYSPTTEPDAIPFWESGEEDVVFSTIDVEMRSRARSASPQP